MPAVPSTPKVETPLPPPPAVVALNSRFRAVYRALTPEEAHLVGTIKHRASELEALCARAVKPDGGRYAALALTSLEQAVMWMVKEVTG